MKVSNILNTLTLKQNFLENENLFQKSQFQKPMLRQIEWRLQNGPITKSGVLPVTTLFFGKFVPVLEPIKNS